MIAKAPESTIHLLVFWLYTRTCQLHAWCPNPKKSLEQNLLGMRVEKKLPSFNLPEWKSVGGCFPRISWKSKGSLQAPESRRDRLNFGIVLLHWWNFRIWWMRVLLGNEPCILFDVVDTGKSAVNFASWFRCEIVIVVQTSQRKRVGGNLFIYNWLSPSGTKIRTSSQSANSGYSPYSEPVF